MIDVTNCEIKDREGGVIQEKQRLGWKEDKWTRQVGEYWANVVACVFFPALSDHFFEHELIISRLAHLPNLQSISAPQSINHSYLALLILSQKSKHSSSTRNLISPSLTQRITSISKSSVCLIACSSLLEPEISSPSDMWFLLIFAYPSLVLPSRVLPIVRSLCERHQNGRVCDFFHSIFLFILRGKVFVVQKLQYVLFVHLFEKRSREEEDTCVTLRHPTFFCYYIRRTLKVFTPKYTKKMSNLDPRVVPIISGQMMNATVLTFLGMFKYKSYYSHPTMNQDHHQMLYQAIRKLIPPPNPIITKHIQPDLPAEMIAHSLPVLRAVDLHSEDQEELKEEECTLSSAYSRHDLVFQRWQRRNNTRNNVTYFASNFCERNNKENLLYIGQLQDNCLEFDCNFDSGNLLAAYKTGEAQYDLILQNDLNSGGYTQWFNFTVSNFKQKGTIKFNIVNFYKKDSLFKEGMKPITRSLVHDKNWKRSCHNIEYFISEMRMQGRKSKCYKILSFKYDFIFQSDTVQFAYCLPYSYQKLNNFLKTLNSSKLRVKYLGATPMKKIVTMLQLSTQSEERKKAVVVMARQHAGETPASHIVQYIIEELLSATQQNQFLFSKYNFYIFPMVNVDGVFLGNYRCNFYGFDLNRCWHLEQSKKHPEIGLIKNQIKRILKRQAIELILDLHGHSAKMNSFFYGNTFGKYNMYFPLVAAKLQEFIDFNSCSFTEQEYQKSNTARVVLGNMIRQTGSAYTFEVSLYGGIKNGKRIPFTGEHYQSMARNLVLAMYKCDVELYKEEKFLKESLFLREVRKEIRKYEARDRKKNDNCSDEEAKKMSIIEEREKIVPEVGYVAKRMKSQREKQERFQATTEQQESQTDFQLVLEDYKMSGTFLNDLVEKKPPQQKKKKLSFSIRKVMGAGGQQSTRKHELMNKLRIFGETFAQQSSILENSNRPAQTSTKETQTLLIYRWRQDSSLQARGTSHSVPRTTTFLANSFLGRRLGEHRRRQRFTKSNSTRVTQAQMSFCDLIKHNKLSFC